MVDQSSYLVGMEIKNLNSFKHMHARTFYNEMLEFAFK